MTPEFEEPQIQFGSWSVSQDQLRGARGVYVMDMAAAALSAQGFVAIEVKKHKGGYRASVQANRYTTDTPPRLVDFASEEASDDATDQSTDSD